MMLSKEQVLDAFRWSSPVELTTRRGPRIKRTAPETEEALDFWRANEPQLVAMGVVHGLKWKSQSQYEFTWWDAIPQEVLNRREESVVLSRATDADLEIPCPEGKAYLEFQKAGIAFCLRVFCEM